MKLVVTMYGANRLSARLSHAANSRWVDKRYYVPSPVQDWRAGRIQRENTEREENYIQAVLRICEEDKIDTIFPSFDPQVYVFSKNKRRFEELGIVIPIPDYDVVVTPLDKYRTIQAAKEAGFPCPKTLLVEAKQDFIKVADAIGFPLIVKQRFTAASRGFAIVRNFAQLTGVSDQVLKQGSCLIQEYIPGRTQHHIFLTLDKQRALKMAFIRLNLRCPFREHQNSATASESLRSTPVLAQAVRLARHINWWGGLAIQTKVDPRDGIPKLMEINPRLGNGLWERVAAGVNEPLMCVQIARNQKIDPADEIPSKTLFLCPVEDLTVFWMKLLDWAIYKIRVVVFHKGEGDPLNCPVSITALISSYKDTYLNRRTKILNLYFTQFMRDPLVSLLWWAQFLLVAVKGIRKLGR